MKDNYQPVFDIYAGYYEDAAKAFNEAAAAQSKARFCRCYESIYKSQ